MWCEPEHVDTNILMLKQKCISAEASTEKVDKDNSSPPSKLVKTDDLFSFMPSSATCTRKRHVSGSTNEVDIYLDEPCLDIKESPLAYWKWNEYKFTL